MFESHCAKMLLFFCSLIEAWTTREYSATPTVPRDWSTQEDSAAPAGLPTTPRHKPNKWDCIANRRVRGCHAMLRHAVVWIKCTGLQHDTPWCTGQYAMRTYPLHRLLASLLACPPPQLPPQSGRQLRRRGSCAADTCGGGDIMNGDLET